MEKPTQEDIRNEELGEPVYTDSDPSYRHGEYRTEVYKREGDTTFWEVTYTVSGDGEENGLREGYADVRQVWPHKVMTTTYKTHKAE